MIELLKQLCALDGVSGYEDEVRAFIEPQVAPYADQLWTDPVGNLIVFKKGRNRRVRPLLVNAHMDEVGYLVRVITESGLLKIIQVGSVDPRIVIGARMRIGPNKIKGVIGLKAFHLTTPEDREKAPKEWELSLDIGASSYEEAAAMVQVGDQVTFDSEPGNFGHECVKAKAIDDRLGCVFIMEMLKKELAYDTYFAFTTSEEIWLRGAPVLARSIDPGVILTFEATTAIDFPGVPEHMRVARFRGGAAIPLVDMMSTYSRDFIEPMLKKADGQGIKWQYRIMSVGATDAGMLHKEGSGGLAFGISVPTRYSHTANPLAYIPDINHCYNLANLVIEEAGACDV